MHRIRHPGKYFPGHLEIIQAILKLSRLSGNFLSHLLTFPVIWKLFRLSENFPSHLQTLQAKSKLPGHLETFQAIWKLFRLSSNFQGHLETLPDSRKLVEALLLLNVAKQIYALFTKIFVVAKNLLPGKFFFPPLDQHLILPSLHLHSLSSPCKSCCSKVCIQIKYCDLG